MSRLLEYIELKKGNVPGWSEVAANRFGRRATLADVNYPYLAGTYSSFLDQLIDAIGIDTALELVAAHDAVKARCYHMREAQK